MLSNQVSDVDIQLRLHYSQSLKSWELQKLIPNHRFSFCWIYLQLLTLSIIRSPWPLSHHWTSLGFHFTGLNPISMVGLSRWPGEVRYPQNINWSLGFLRDRFLDPSSSPHTLHHWVPSYRHMVSHTIAMLMTHSSFYHSTRWSNGSCTDLRLLNLAGLHYTTSERSGPSLHSMQHNFLSRPLLFLDWTTAKLF